MAKKIMKETVKKNYMELLYMTSSIVTAKELAKLFLENSNIKIELWEEMNVLELELPNHNTVDVEPLDIQLTNPSDVAFVKNRNIQTIFSINLVDEDLPVLLPYLQLIAEKHHGFVCADSIDFQPVYAGSSDRNI